MQGEQDELDRRIHQAAQQLRRQAPMQDKLALLRTLRVAEDKPASVWQRLGIMWERHSTEWRQPLYGFAFALVLALAIGLGISFDRSSIDAPEIDDIEFSGGSAMVIEKPAAHTTLIWLSEVDDESMQDEPGEQLIEGEDSHKEEAEEEDI